MEKVTFLFVATAIVQASVIPKPIPPEPVTTILQAPSTKTKITGPDGSIIISETPGAEIVHQEIPGSNTMTVGRWSAPMETIRLKRRNSDQPMKSVTEDQKDLTDQMPTVENPSPIDEIIAHSNGLLKSGQDLIPPNPAVEAAQMPLKGFGALGHMSSV